MSKAQELSNKPMNPEFSVHVLNDFGMKKAGEIANLFNDLLHSLSDICPHKTREFSLVRTKLEEACFFAKKSIAGDTDNQKEYPDVREKAA